MTKWMVSSSFKMNIENKIWRWIFLECFEFGISVIELHRLFILFSLLPSVNISWAVIFHLSQFRIESDFSEFVFFFVEIEMYFPNFMYRTQEWVATKTCTNNFNTIFVSKIKTNLTPLGEVSISSSFLHAASCVFWNSEFLFL